MNIQAMHMLTFREGNGVTQFLEADNVNNVGRPVVWRPEESGASTTREWEERKRKEKCHQESCCSTRSNRFYLMF